MACYHYPIITRPGRDNYPDSHGFVANFFLGQLPTHRRMRLKTRKCVHRFSTTCRSTGSCERPGTRPLPST